MFSFDPFLLTLRARGEAMQLRLPVSALVFCLLLSPAPALANQRAFVHCAAEPLIDTSRGGMSLIHSANELRLRARARGVRAGPARSPVPVERERERETEGA